MKDWFVRNQVVIAFVAGSVSVFTVLLLDARWPSAILVFTISLALIFVGQRLYISDDSDNWLTLSWGSILKTVVSYLFMLFGWIFFLRGLLALAIASLLLYLD
jgi:hypothetical protein